MASLQEKVEELVKILNEQPDEVIEHGVIADLLASFLGNAEAIKRVQDSIKNVDHDGDE